MKESATKNNSGIKTLLFFAVLLANPQGRTSTSIVPPPFTAATLTALFPASGSLFIAPEKIDYWTALLGLFQCTAAVVFAIDSGLNIAELSDYALNPSNQSEFKPTYTLQHKIVPSIGLFALAVAEEISSLQDLQRLNAGIALPPGAKFFHFATKSVASSGFVVLGLGVSANLISLIRTGNVMISLSYNTQTVTTNWKLIGCKPVLIWKVAVGTVGGTFLLVSAFMPAKYPVVTSGLLTAGLSLLCLSLLPYGLFTLVKTLQGRTAA